MLANVAVIQHSLLALRPFYTSLLTAIHLIQHIHSNTGDSSIGASLYRLSFGVSTTVQAYCSFDAYSEFITKELTKGQCY